MIVFSCDLQEGKGGRTALHYAVERNQAQVMLCLVRECNCALEIETYGGLTPYQVAAEINPELGNKLESMGSIPLHPRMDDSDSSSSDSDDFS